MMNTAKTEWETPELVEVKMDAEIGSYQEDFREEERFAPFASPSARAATPE